jgi:hypothetical protein
MPQNERCGIQPNEGCGADRITMCRHVFHAIGTIMKYEPNHRQLVKAGLDEILVSRCSILWLPQAPHQCKHGTCADFHLIV